MLRSTFFLAALFSALLARADEPLDILIYGASGKLGTPMVMEALDRGHHVTAVSRRPESYTLEHENLTVSKGDLLEPDSIAELVDGRDVVIVSVRGVIGEPDSPTRALQFIAAENLVDALYPLGDDGPRLLHVGGSGSLYVKPGKLYADVLPRWTLGKKFNTEIDGQILTLEFLKKVNDVRWTYITPPKWFSNGERTGNYRLGGDIALEDARGRTRISRTDFAVAVIDEADSGAHVRQRISVAY